MFDLGVQDSKVNCLGDSIGQFAFWPQKITDFAAQTGGPDHLVVAYFGKFCGHHDLACIRNIGPAEDVGGAKMRR